MEDKDYIKELFSKKLGDHTEPVNPDIWSAVKAQTTASVSTATTTLITKVVVTAVSVLSLTAGVYWAVKKNNTSNVSINKQNSIPKEGENKKVFVENKEVKPSPAEENEDIITSISADEVNNSKEENNVHVFSDSSFKENTNYSADSIPLYIKQKSTVLSNTDSLNNPIQNKKILGVENEKKTLPEFSIISQNDDGVYVFSLDTDDYDFIEWSFGDGNYSTQREAKHLYNSSGKYEVEARIIKGDLQKRSTVSVGSEAVGEIGKLPSVVTCNNDGFNDALVLETKNLSDFQITILDRSNQVVFKSSDAAFSWGGIDLTGEPVEPGNYVYIITAVDTAGNPINEYQMIEVRR